MSLQAVYVEYCLCLGLVILPPAENQISFTSVYRGSTVRGTAGSSLQFNWSFSGDVKFVDWGLTQAADSVTFNQILLSLTKSGPRSVTPPPAYAGRVSGIRSENGHVIFTLSNLHSGDARFYGCRIKSPPHLKYDNVKLVVEDPPRIIHFSGNQTVSEGDNLSLNCTADGNPMPTITWTRLTDNSVVTMPMNVSRRSQGTYRCTADNTIGNPATADAFVTVQYQPTITAVAPLTTKTWIAQSVSLDCAADGIPTPTITWKNPNGSKIKEVTDTQNIAVALMETDQDFGNYTCDAKNVIGAAAARTVQVIQIKAPSSPKIILQDQDIQATSLTVKWTAPADDGGSPITAYRVVILQGEIALRNANITDPDAREISFGSLKRNTNYNLKVYARNYVFEGDAVQKTFKTKFEGVPLAADIIGLPAETKKPQVTVKWNEPEYNGAPITQYTVYQRTLRDDGTLSPWKKIMDTSEVSVRQAAVNLEKGKQYEFLVTATNKFGESFKEADKVKRIKVLGDVPMAVKQKEIRYAEVTLKWDEPVNNGANITQFSIYQRITGDERWETLALITEVSKREYVVKVEKGKGYEFVVTARNKYGESSRDKIETVKISEVSSPPPETQADSLFGKDKLLHTIYVSVIAVLLVIVFTLLVVLWRSRRRLETQKIKSERARNLVPRCPTASESKPEEELIALNPMVNQEEAGGQPSVEEQKVTEPKYEIISGGDYMPLHPSTRSREISREQVNVIKIIGKGAFSEVAKATLQTDNQKQITVAAKMLKANAPASDRRDLLSELELMTKLKPHPHVIKLIGCVTENDPLLVLIEYVPFGDLLGYLRKSRGLNDTYYKDPDVKPQTNLTAEQLMKFAWQVADGMCYLSSKKIIHRDLAARNVLVGEGGKCKVTDFGMARNLHQDDIYSRKSRGRLPVKWTAYEALVFGIYTTQSDVWSYGILLYEIITIGGSPYPDINARQIAQKLQEGYRMPKPTHVDSKLYEIMLKCWEEQPTDRPMFEKLRKTMKDMEKHHKTYVNLSQYDNSLYANVKDLADE